MNDVKYMTECYLSRNSPWVPVAPKMVMMRGKVLICLRTTASQSDKRDLPEG